MPEADPLSVLLVEDSPLDAEFVELALRANGFELELERVDSAEAMRVALERRSWDVIVSDYRLPDFDTMEALELAHELGDDTPFLIVSGTIGEEATVAALKAGVRSVVLKSNLSELGPTIERELDDRDTRRGQREAERALRESEERFRRLAENAPDVIYRYRLEPEPAVEYLSPASASMSGYTLEDFAADPELARKIIHPDDLPLLEETTRSTEPTTLVRRWLHREGHVIWVETHSVPVFDDGRVVAYEGIARDVTERQRAAEAIREADERLRLVLAAGAMAVVEVDLATGTLEWTGDALEWLFGPSAREGSKSWTDLLERVHPEDHETAAAALERTVAGEGAHLEFRVVTDGGTIRWVGAHAVLVQATASSPDRLAGVWVDITERKRAEEALRETNEALLTLVEASPIAIASRDLEGRVTMWNPAAERLYGWTADELLGRAFPHVPIDGTETNAEFRERVRSGQVVAGAEVTRVRRDGALIEVSLSLVPLHDATGAVRGEMAVAVDITEQKRAVEELRRSFELLQRSDEHRRQLLKRLVRAQEEERSRIASDIHDDSVQVITALALRLDLLQRQIDDSELRAAVTEITETARSSIGRLRRLMFELRPPALDRDGLVGALRQYLETMNAERGIEFTLEADVASEPDPETRVIAYRILQEALTNVVKHADATAVDVTVHATGDGLRARIADDGKGFSTEERLTGDTIGHLGMTAMRERAEIAGGWWTIESAPGSGTAVEFELPVATDG